MTTTAHHLRHIALHWTDLHQALGDRPIHDVLKSLRPARPVRAVPPKEPLMLTFRIPDDLCPTHRELARRWRDNHYDRHNPSEWPAGMSTPHRFHLMDGRTPHATRERDFDEKNREQIDFVIAICRSGRSPECEPRSYPDGFGEQAFRDLHGIPAAPVETITPPAEYL
ncbi:MULTISPECIES: hypothetical protein [Streptomyces]|uniref:Uncharacterized protein n=1 Tax=Streptomyces fradiae ATCC 10745 = DSM 40063 TaxID=1319510 RepID=A0ABQ6XLT7_STRFR|nr:MULTISPECIES: hypothetical protein [Streptomyces]KAF0646746.1 hypothetical protein K701_27585 [Streptomyces fradiae ATCC 10745 = DSM 40063]QEV11654.1 hypothetical protein CP974_06090 [Streptomyces fradiae ATCC 10745 = DSM 40063]